MLLPVTTDITAQGIVYMTCLEMGLNLGEKNCGSDTGKKKTYTVGCFTYVFVGMKLNFITTNLNLKYKLSGLL